MHLIAVAVVHKVITRVSDTVLAYIGIGSNLQEPVAQVKQAIEALKQLPESQLLTASSLYGSKPMGPQDQPDYVNAVALMSTALPPLTLLQALQEIEHQQGRVRLRRWGERTLDLDLLLYGEQQINIPELIVPHIGIAERNFVLYPLQEISPNLVIPQLGSLDNLLANCPRDGLALLGS